MKAKNFFWFLTGLLILSMGFAAFAAVPEKPYPDLADGDTLTDVIYNGTLNVLYEWAQSTNASVTRLMSGSGLTETLTASRTASVASVSMPLLWDSTGGKNLSMSGSGTMSFMAFAEATGLDKNNFASFYFVGGMYSNGTDSALFGDPISLYGNQGATSTAWDLVASVTSSGGLFWEASTTASVTWNLSLIRFEGHYPP